MKLADVDKAEDAPFALEQFFPTLAAHALMTAHPDVLHGALAPEIAEQIVSFIYGFVLVGLASDLQSDNYAAEIF